MKIIDIRNKNIESIDYGNKAYWLSWLYQKGYQVPYAIFLPADRNEIIKFLSEQKNFYYLEEQLKTFKTDREIFNVAIRSSTTCEDSFNKSFAGYFTTFIELMSFDDVVNNIKKIIEEFNSICFDNNDIGIIIQKFIKSSFSGVIASSNPLSGAKFESVISVVSGNCADLVSGKKAGEDIFLRRRKNQLITSRYKSPIHEKCLEKIFSIAKTIEDDLGYPVDLEWCIDTDLEIHILQCRPLTGIFFSENFSTLVSQQTKKELPKHILDNEKINITLTAEEYKILQPKTYVFSINCLQNISGIPIIIDQEESANFISYTTMLIYPEKLSEKKSKLFFGEKEWGELFAKGCSRYCVRSYPKYRTLKDSILGIVQNSNHQHWVVVLIVQEIWNHSYSGIIRQVSEGYIIELTHGYFISKGLTPCSRYFLTDIGKIISCHEIHQDKCFRIIDGTILEEKLTYDDSLIKLSEENLLSIIKTFEILLKDKSDLLIEFGLIYKKSSYQSYLIDIIKEKSGVNESSQLGFDHLVMSRGKIKGKAILLGTESRIEEILYFLNGDPKKSYIIITEKPDINLIEIIKHRSKNIGFIFNQGSMLCHFAILLRENSIPALIFETATKIVEGELLGVDALTSNLSIEKRITKYKD